MGSVTLIVGLGNPGPRYEETPHNLGFLAIDRLAERNRIRVSRPEGSAIVGPGEINGSPVLLAKPQTFMNLSGTSVRALLTKYDSGPQDLILVYDELALPWGALRIRPRGSAGGHNGVESVIRSLGSMEFSRVRLGIHPGHPLASGTDFLLSPMRRVRKEELDEVLELAARAVESIIAEGVEKSMAKFNRRAQGLQQEEE